MKLLHVRFDSREVNKILGNAAKYSFGFLDGIDMEQIVFMNRLAEFVVDALGKYIDAQARGNPDALHHVYEWGSVGSESGRLFSLNGRASKRVINITGSFLPSSSISDTATEPFVDKANIMENGIAITISPNSSDVLVFEAGGATVFTANSVYVANPGGDAVAGSFGRAVDMFFSSYFTNALLAPFIAELSRAEEFPMYFPEGTRSGYPAGIKAGKAYMNSPRLVLE